MKIVYSEIQQLHKPRQEWNFGRNTPYPEKNKRVETIVAELRKRGYSKEMTLARQYSINHILAVHEPKMVKHIKSCEEMGENEAVYAHIFPYRSYSPNPKTDLRRAGFFCFDVGSQIGKHTFKAAKSAVDVALHGAFKLLSGKERAVFALCRPPGHHADTAAYGGYCYFNNAAIAAYELTKRGRVAIIDLDFHHGNGTQSIFYEQPHVFFVSIHGDPVTHYPYFCGFKNETGRGLGRGTNLNIPLPAGVDDQEYRRHLQRIVNKLKRWNPTFVIVSMGFDTYLNDPLGDFKLTSDFYAEIGGIFKAMKKPVLACLEGGYAMKELGVNAANFYEGLVKG